MAEVNYLGYAQLMGQRNPTAEGLATLGQSLDQMQATDRQRKMDAMTMEQNRRASSLADLQMQTGQAALAKGQAEQGALADLYGTTGQPDAYAKALSFQAQEQKDVAQKKATLEENANKVKTLTETFKSVSEGIKNRTIDAASGKSLFETTMKLHGIDFSKAGVNFDFTDKGGYYSGPIKETDLIRVNGQDVPYGSGGIVEKALVVGIGPDGKTPIYQIDKDTTFKEASADKKETWSEPYMSTVGGKKVMLQKSSTGQIKPVVQDTSTTVKMDSGGSSPVAQSAFVDPATGKPLVFDKKTGTYRVATVEGGVTPKPAAFTPESAAKAQLVEQGLTYIPQIREGLIGPDGKVDKVKVANLAARTPFTEGRKMSTLILDAVEAKLRAESGAAVPEPEVKRAAKRFIPQVGDNDATVKLKIDNLETFLKGTSEKINQGRQGGGAANKPMVTKGGFKITVVK